MDIEHEASGFTDMPWCLNSLIALVQIFNDFKVIPVKANATSEYCC
jgi:hypothetical protein